LKIQKSLLFSTRSYTYLQKAIAKISDFELGDVERKDFPDGEHYHRILSKVADRDIVLLGGTISDADTLEIYDLACALVKYGAKSLTLVIPYFGYSTMERAVRPGEVVTAKTRARLFSAIPAASVPNRVILIDLHSDGIPHYFEGSVRPFHLYAKPVIQEAILEIAQSDFVLACTDAGRAKWVESLANDLRVRASFVFKKRLSGNKTKVVAVSAQVEDKYVVIYDDMIRTGNSLINAAKAYREAGAIKISVVATHGLFPGNSLERIRNSRLFQKVICTDSHPRAVKLKNGFLKIKSTANLIANFLKG